MEGTARIWFTPQQRAELWERCKNGLFERAHWDSATKGPLCANSGHRPLYVVGQPQSQKATIKNVSTRPFAIAPN